MNSKPYLVSMNLFCDEMAGLVNNERAVDVIDRDFSKIFATFCHSILTDKTEEASSRHVDCNMGAEMSSWFSVVKLVSSN